LYNRRPGQVKVEILRPEKLDNMDLGSGKCTATSYYMSVILFSQSVFGYGWGLHMLPLVNGTSRNLTGHA